MLSCHSTCCIQMHAVANFGSERGCLPALDSRVDHSAKLCTWAVICPFSAVMVCHTGGTCCCLIRP